MPAEAPFINLIKGHSIIFETGTHKGTGSTQFLASLSPEKLITMEVNYSNFVQAISNLSQYPFVTCLWGLSVPRDQAQVFIKGNPDLFNLDLTQDSDNPVEFYMQEIGQAGIDDLLGQYLPLYKDQNPLILLDSAGGMGYMEFLYVLEIMGSSRFTLILDDTNHVKHYRSRAYILQDPTFEVLYDNLEGGGIMIAKKKGA